MTAHHHHGHRGHGHVGSNKDEEEDDSKTLFNALSGDSDKGSRVTLIGLAANIGLTAIKGIAGYLLKSASLIADAGHSLSDLIGDLITLIAWKWSRKPPDKNFPFGYGKFESIGSLIVAFFLLSGGLGIGLHSYTLIQPILTTNLPTQLSKLLPRGKSHHHQHEHEHEQETDIRASYFALLSILVKESLYRITYKVGKIEQSNVLMANALHHRSDAFSSLVALLAIVGSWFGLKILDPIGGFLVCGMIIKSGIKIGKNSILNLIDKRQDFFLDRDIENFLFEKIKNLNSQNENFFLIEINNVKHIKFGSKFLFFVHLNLSPPLPPTTSSSSNNITTTKKSDNNNVGLLHFSEWVAIQNILIGLINKEFKNVLDVYINFSLKN